ncbi:MAG TPA: lysophospholipid acyltransferase family protein [Acidimicrobiales bacterium]|nr:lysophospholipid acyltransferase family protein [Acidimicrobiales bacterium]
MGYWLLKVVLTPVLLVAYRVRCPGRSQVPARGGAILAANHQSFCDSIFLPLCVRRRVTYLAKAEYFDSWRTRWFFSAVGQIPIHRGGGSASERALATAREVLADGRLVALYPEGTRAGDGCTHRGRTGVARLSLDGGVPVIPVGISGTAGVQPIGRRVPRPFRRVTVAFGAPRTLTPEGVAESGEEGLRRFTDELMAEIAALSGRPYVDSYVARRG